MFLRTKNITRFLIMARMFTFFTLLYVTQRICLKIKNRGKTETNSKLFFQDNLWR